MLIPLRVRDVMTETVETTESEAVVADVATHLRDAGIGSLVVVEGGRPVGVVTKSDLVAVLADGASAEAMTAETVMSSPLVTIGADAALDRAAETMEERGVKHLPVVDDGELVGIVTTTDLSYYLPELSLQHNWRDADEYARLGTDEVAYESADWEFTHTRENGAPVGVGDTVRFSKELSETDVRSFAQSSGDTNRLHLDDEFARETRFGRRIAHGTLVSGVISAALARIPGLTIYLSQDLRFLGPVDVGETVTAVCEVVEDLGGDRFRLMTAVYDEDGERVVDGEAIVLVDELSCDVGEKLEPVERAEEDD
ncbi:CBS domain-containing protein [Halomarina halobia]|uniref:CBS domain-containing protein n=1 Tax=Halomarina halobia TaxID=3033386 RepID=A0ABD6A9J6_9EURY|nr:CBS domain-containing protein [Halomarina sp. PSR21]